MNLIRFASLIGCLMASPLLLAQDEAHEASTAESAAFHAITEAMAKTRQGGETPSEEDFKMRREGGKEMAVKARQFLKDFPASSQTEDARALLSMGLAEAAVAGDVKAAEELQANATEIVNDPKVPDMLKLHAFAVNHLVQWAIKNGKRSLHQQSAEFQMANIEAFFAAVDVLPNKDSIFKMLLLQAKSARELSAEDKRSVAERVLANTNAPPAIKAEARNILTGKPAYAIGKPLDISFTAVDGRKVNLAEMKGKVVLVDFWATWCGPCVGEVPAIKAAYDKHHAEGFEIVGISLDDKKKDLLDFIKKHDMPWPQYFDGKHWNNDLSFRFGINSVPTQWLVDKKGNLRNTEARFNLEQSVRRLLEED